MNPGLVPRLFSSVTSKEPLAYSPVAEGWAIYTLGNFPSRAAALRKRRLRVTPWPQISSHL